jgi:pyruvate dehydrogenase E1 component alpha subunit
MAKTTQARRGKKVASKLSDEQKLTLYRNLVRTDHYDRMMMRRMKTGQLVGFYHPGEGAIAPGVGMCSFLRKEDILWPHHRAHAQPHMLSKGIDLKYYLAEHTGKQTGCCQGRSSYHWSFPKDGVFGFSGCIGAGFSPSVGWGLACKMNGQQQVTVNAFGDGGSNRAPFHEAMLHAANWKLPIIFAIENNGLAIYSKADEMHPTDDISDLAKGYNITAKIVDGQDVFACAEAGLEAIEYCRSGKGPYMIEFKTQRYWEHDIGTPDLSGWTPRPVEEIDKLRERDPIELAREQLLKEKLLTQELIDQIDAEAVQEVADAEKFAEESPVSEDIDLNNIDKMIYAD